MLVELDSQNYGFDVNFIDNDGQVQSVVVIPRGKKIVVEIPLCIISPEDIPHFKRLLERAARKAKFEQSVRS